jgi:hypothetical protein
MLNLLGGPPAAFDSAGHHLGTLGSRGRGPGETTWPWWVDASLDDSVRVFEMGRVVAFAGEMRRARTTPDVHPQLPRSAAVLRPGVYAMISAKVQPSPEPHPNPLLIRTDDGRLLRSIDIPLLNGGVTRTRFTRDLNDSRGLWLVQYQERTLHGYRITHLDESGVRGITFDRLPDWWKMRTADVPRGFSPTFPAEPVSLIVDAQQISPDLLAVLVATPRADWPRVPFNTKTNEGYWDRLETVVEVVDLRLRKLVAVGRVPDSPVSMAARDRIATYREDSEGYPQLTIWRFSLEQSGRP